MVFTHISETSKCEAIHKMQHFATHMQRGVGPEGTVTMCKFHCMYTVGL